MTLTDEELDRNWVPNGRRPQSTIARSFSKELMDIFRIDDSVADLNDKVEKQKKQLDTQTNELEALEARIREMDERLQRSRGDTVTGPVDAAAIQAAASAHQRKDLPILAGKKGMMQQNATPLSGVMPPTPSASEDGHE
jgi:chromosome segregation ATPase